MILVLLMACRGVEGLWTGTLECTADGFAWDAESEVELFHTEGMEYEGEWFAEGPATLWGQQGQMRQEADVTVTLQSRTGAQDLDVDFDDCALLVDGTPWSTDCGDAGVEDLEWDGKDGIEAEDADCELELTRE